jgi:hypothetical protein
MSKDRPFHFELDRNWEAITGPRVSTYMRKGRDNNNALQVSFTINTSNVHPQIDPEEVVAAWVEHIGGAVIETSSSCSAFGKTASATFSARDLIYCQAWFSTDDIDTIQATFLCDGQPSDAELAEVSQMVHSMRLGAAEPTKKSGWWPF